MVRRNQDSTLPTNWTLAINNENEQLLLQPLSVALASRAPKGTISKEVYRKGGTHPKENASYGKGTWMNEKASTILQAQIITELKHEDEKFKQNLSRHRCFHRNN